MLTKINLVANKAILVVGDGRGFVISHRHQRLIVTAAHCLPFFPPCHGASYTEERTYPKLLAPLGAQPEVWAECLFADPIADIAVLGSPDNQVFFEEANAYEALVESIEPFSIAEAPEEGHGWLCSLSGQWFGCAVQYLKHVDGPLWIFNTEQPIQGGMSGSPILSDDRAAIGIVNLGSVTPKMPDGCEAKYGLPNARLMRDLPGWVLRAVNGNNDK
jgi:hypothetical protein